MPSLVHSVNPICATSSGRTQCVFRSRTGSAKGEAVAASASSQARRRSRVSGRIRCRPCRVAEPAALVVAEQQGAEPDSAACRFGEAATTNSWPSEHLSLSQSAERRDWYVLAARLAISPSQPRSQASASSSARPCCGGGQPQRGPVGEGPAQQRLPGAHGQPAGVRLLQAQQVEEVVRHTDPARLDVPAPGQPHAPLEPGEVGAAARERDDLAVGGEVRALLGGEFLDDLRIGVVQTASRSGQQYDPAGLTHHQRTDAVQLPLEDPLGAVGEVRRSLNVASMGPAASSTPGRAAPRSRRSPVGSVSRRVSAGRLTGRRRTRRPGRECVRSAPSGRGGDRAYRASRPRRARSSQAARPPRRHFPVRRGSG